MDYDYSELRRLYRHFLNSKYGRTRWFVRIPEREKEYSQYKWERVLCRRFDCIKNIANANADMSKIDSEISEYNRLVAVWKKRRKNLLEAMNNDKG